MDNYLTTLSFCRTLEEELPPVSGHRPIGRRLRHRGLIKTDACFGDWGTTHSSLTFLETVKHIRWRTTSTSAAATIRITSLLLTIVDNCTNPKMFRCSNNPLNLSIRRTGFLGGNCYGKYSKRTSQPCRPSLTSSVLIHLNRMGD